MRIRSGLIGFVVAFVATLLACIAAILSLLAIGIWWWNLRYQDPAVPVLVIGPRDLAPFIVCAGAGSIACSSVWVRIFHRAR